MNNTIADNEAGLGLALYSEGFDSDVLVVNNVLVASGGAQSVIHCEGEYDPDPPIIRFNDVLKVGRFGGKYSGICPDVTGLEGNISADPFFVEPRRANYHLRSGSPAIDVGTAEGAPDHDIDGDPRPLDGDGDGNAEVDMGADELRR